jgi:hypothetical protein
MMCCGQMRALGSAAYFANRLTLIGLRWFTIRNSLSPLSTWCGIASQPVDYLCPNREWNRWQLGTEWTVIFVP